jgi:hypothetical protein
MGKTKERKKGGGGGGGGERVEGGGLLDCCVCLELFFLFSLQIVFFLKKKFKLKHVIFLFPLKRGSFVYFLFFWFFALTRE